MTIPSRATLEILDARSRQLKLLLVNAHGAMERFGERPVDARVFCTAAMNAVAEIMVERLPLGEDPLQTLDVLTDTFRELLRGCMARPAAPAGPAPAAADPDGAA